ncbi:YciI family protein [Ureibacillus sp. FSL E2-3493]|uniref:YciI family protein n=1 Tax=Ureibacillus sp. FSL E2-3493 TaxID=2921367 RepID=UPI0031193DED
MEIRKGDREEMQYIITAYDGADEKAIERRLMAREAHLKSVEERVKEGQHLYGAAILDDNGKMRGSMIVVDFPSREELENWLRVEPYVVANVWQKIEIKPCKVAPIFMELYD